MIKQKNIRNKRFVLEEEAELKGLWSNQPGQILTLTYAYTTSAIKKLAFVERVSVAIETLNKLSLVRLKYEPMDMGSLPNVCPLELSYLKAKFKNQIIFKTGDNITDEEGCGTRASLLYNKQALNYFSTAENNDTDVSLKPFSNIICNVENSFF